MYVLSPLFWDQISYMPKHYNVGLNILAIVPDYHRELFGIFADLPLELGGMRRKRGRV